MVSKLTFQLRVISTSTYIPFHSHLLALAKTRDVRDYFVYKGTSLRVFKRATNNYEPSNKHPSRGKLFSAPTILKRESRLALMRGLENAPEVTDQKRNQRPSPRQLRPRRRTNTPGREIRLGW